MPLLHKPRKAILPAMVGWFFWGFRLLACCGVESVYSPPLVTLVLEEAFASMEGGFFCSSTSAEYGCSESGDPLWPPRPVISLDRYSDVQQSLTLGRVLAVTTRRAAREK